AVYVCGDRSCVRQRQTKAPRFFFSSRRRHTRSYGDWSSDVCSSDLYRVPCIARWPGKIPANHTSAQPAVMMDLFATALKAASVKIGRASCREKSRSRWWRGELEKNKN